MVDPKKAALGLGLLVATGGAIVLASAKGEPAPEGTPEGNISISITPVGRRGFYFDKVKGAWAVGATINVNGLCTAGFPLPSMVLELYDNGSLRKTTTIPTVALGTSYPLSEAMGVADIGDHDVYGRMVLTNALGSYEFTTSTQSFSIGEAPPGQVDIEVVLTPP